VAGAQFGTGTRVMIDQSAFAANTGDGIRADTGSIVNVNRSVMSHNATGLHANGGSITLSNSDISFNTTKGISVTAGSVISFNNSRLRNNAVPGDPTTLI